MEKRGSMVHRLDGYTVAVNRRGDRMVTAGDGSFHMLFRKSDGYTAKWGKTMEDDPTHCPWGNEIADIEITTICRGIRQKDADGNITDTRSNCNFCYKSLTGNGSYMSFDTFRKVFDLMDQPKTMTQIAFGVDAECRTNPDVWRIMDYCLEHGVTPNVTVADIDKETAENIVKRCGACAVSCYERNKDCCYDSIRLLTEEAKKQGRDHFKVNMHLMVAKETEKFVFEVLEDRLSEQRLEGMGAIVLLSLKRKGRGVSFRKMDDEVYRKVVFFLQDHGIAYGSDSCGANRLVQCLKEYYKDDPDRLKSVLSSIEECEALRFSGYVNVKGEVFPCSFIEGEPGWETGIDLTDAMCKNYTLQIWNHPRILEWRKQSMKCVDCHGRCKCPHYEI